MLARKGICVTQILDKVEDYQITEDMEQLCIKTLYTTLLSEPVLCLKMDLPTENDPSLFLPVIFWYVGYGLNGSDGFKQENNL